MRDKGTKRHPDRAIARLARDQHGVVSTAQLRAAGLSANSLTRRLRAGRLHRLHQGVYAVGHLKLSVEGRWLAAVLACGDGAVLSHRSAAGLWRVGPAIASPVDVTVPGQRGRKRPGIRIHRSPSLTVSQVTIRNRIAVTTPARTLEDLRRVLPPKEFAATLREAECLRLPIGQRFEPDHTRSELEQRLLRLCRQHRLPQPEVNVQVDSFLVDFLWRAGRLVAEVDGYRYHGTRSAFETDRARDARLKVLGYDVVRFTWRQLTEERRDVAATLRALLARRAS
jgi:very-short-patch-repair endonuclease